MSTPKMKKCSKCHRVLPATNEFFAKYKRSKDGLQGYCKDCQKAYNHSPQGKASQKKYYKTHKEEKLADQKEYDNNHKEEIAARQKDYSETHKEEKAANYKVYRQTPKGKAANKNVRHRRRQLEKKGKGFNIEQQNEMLQFFDYKCPYKGIPLTDNNIHLDHIVPLSKGGEHEVWNMIPCHCSANLSKNDSNMEEWYKKQEYFSEERLLKIYEWMQYASEKYCK